MTDKSSSCISLKYFENVFKSLELHFGSSQNHHQVCNDGGNVSQNIDIKHENRNVRFIPQVYFYKWSAHCSSTLESKMSYRSVLTLVNDPEVTFYTPIQSLSQ